MLPTKDGHHLPEQSRDFPDSPGVKTSPSNAVGAGLTPCRGAEIPHASWPKTKKKETKTENRSNIVTNSMKILKMVHIKKILKKKKSVWCYVPIGRINRSRNQGVEVGVAPFTINPSDPTGVFMSPQL